MNSVQFCILFLLKAVEYKYLLQICLSECTIAFENDAESCVGKIEKYLHVLRVDFLISQIGAVGGTLYGGLAAGLMYNVTII